MFRSSAGAISLRRPSRSMVALALASAVAVAAAQQRATWDGGALIDNGDGGYSQSGTWTDKGGVADDDYYDQGIDWTATRFSTTAGNWAQWTPNLAAGRYRVYFWKAPTTGIADIGIVHANGTTTIRRAMQDGDQGWNTLGDFDFNAGTGGYVKMTVVSGGVCADAMKFVPVAGVKTLSFPPYPAPDGSLPHIDKKGGGNWVISGKQMILTYGETLEQSTDRAADMPYMDNLFDKARDAGVRLLCPILQWKYFETAEGVYDYTMIDTLISKAKARNMHLGIVWFGSWRNLKSYYIPGYFYDDTAKYFFARDADGTKPGGQDIISPFCQAAWERDGLALKALLARAALKDPDHQVLLCVQVENEMPSQPDMASPQALAARNTQVPKEVIDYMVANEGQLGDRILQTWYATGKKTSGTWAEVFGSTAEGWRIFSSYHYGRYVERVIEKAREGLNIPMYCNAWNGVSPSDRGYMDMFHLGAPALEGMGPDAYDGNRDFNIRLHERDWNSLVVPEALETHEFFRAMANHRALLNGAYHAVEISSQTEYCYATVYKLLQEMMPLLTAKRYNGDLFGFYQGMVPDSTVATQDYQEFRITFTTTNTDGPMQALGPHLWGNGLIMKMAENDYVLTAVNTDLDWRYADGGDIGVASAETGHFSDGAWVKESDYSVAHNGASLHFAFPSGYAATYSQVRVRLNTRPRFVNAALYKPAKQSGTDFSYASQDYAGPPGPVNGNDGVFKPYAYVSTGRSNNDPYDYWEVDLGKSYAIDHIRLYNTTQPFWLKNFYVLVSDSPFVSPNIDTARAAAGVGAYPHPAQADTVETIDVKRNGRYVRVQLDGANPGTMLRFCEARVLAAPPTVPIVAHPVESAPNISVRLLPHGIQVSVIGNGKYDIRLLRADGRALKRLVGKGELRATVDTREMGSGPCLLRIKAGDRGLSKRIMLWE